MFQKFAGLDKQGARAVSTPSGMGRHGLVRHVENAERGWWRLDVAGEEGLQFDGELAELADGRVGEEPGD